MKHLESIWKWTRDENRGCRLARRLRLYPNEASRVISVTLLLLFYTYAVCKSDSPRRYFLSSTRSLYGEWKECHFTKWNIKSIGCRRIARDNGSDGSDRRVFEMIGFYAGFFMLWCNGHELCKRNGFFLKGLQNKRSILQLKW